MATALLQVATLFWVADDSSLGCVAMFRTAVRVVVPVSLWIGPFLDDNSKALMRENPALSSPFGTRLSI